MPIAIAKAVHILERGGLVAFPTETVYGLGADASNEEAVRAIFRAKQRPFNHPVIVHLAELSQLETWARDISEDAYRLAQHFWPGPLTIILKKKPNVLNVITGNQDTVGLRIPNHPVALSLLHAFGRGIAAPSANRFTHISPTTAEAVDEELHDKIDLILKGGACSVGLESTIIDMSRQTPTILRPGMITRDEIATFLNKEVLVTHQSEVQTPGMHHLHYAPTTKTILLTHDELINHAKTSVKSAYLLYHERLIKNHFVIQMPKDVNQYAHCLYQTLRQLDQQQFEQIIIEDVPHEEAWLAIRDRLMKATAKRN